MPLELLPKAVLRGVAPAMTGLNNCSFWGQTLGACHAGWLYLLGYTEAEVVCTLGQDISKKELGNEPTPTPDALQVIEDVASKW